MKHKECNGHFTLFTIREHGYSFFRCEKCGFYLGGDKTEAKVGRLMRTKVWPTLRRV